MSLPLECARWSEKCVVLAYIFARRSRQLRDAQQRSNTEIIDMHAKLQYPYVARILQCRFNQVMRGPPMPTS